MYKRLWFATLGVIGIMITGMVLTSPANAQPGEYDYQIQVLRDGQPLPNTYVRLSGVGVEMTNANGIAIFDLSDAPGRGQGRQELWRGPIYAARIGKASGAVIDEYNLLHVIVASHDIGEEPQANEPSFTFGTQILIKLNTIYSINLN